MVQVLGNITLADGAAGTISITPSTTGVVDIQGSMNPYLIIYW